MGILDQISEGAFKLSDAFLPTNERLQNQLIRERIQQSQFSREQEARRQQVLKDLFNPPQQQGLLAGPQGGPTTLPQGEQTGLLAAQPSAQALNQRRAMFAEAFPQIAAQVLGSQLFPGAQTGRLNLPETTAFLESQLDRPLSEQEIKELGGIADRGTDLSELASRVQIEVDLANLNRINRENAAKKLSGEQQLKANEINTETLLNNLEEFAEVNERLRDTFLSPGVLGADIRGNINSLLAEFSDDPKFGKLQTDFNTFNKFASGSIMDSLARMIGTGAVQTAKFEVLQQSLAGIGSDPDTNNTIIANFIQDVLNEAAIAGTDVPDIERWQALIGRLKGGQTREQALDDLLRQ